VTNQILSSSAGNGVTANDAGDGDTGANNLQNFPVLSSSSSLGGSTTISGSLNSTASTTFTLEFFSNTVGDPSGFGEGQQFLGSTTVTTNSTGNASFTATFAVTVRQVTSLRPPPPTPITTRPSFPLASLWRCQHRAFPSMT
jgi:hypothetical protein